MSSISLAPTIVFDSSIGKYVVSCWLDGHPLSATALNLDGAISWFASQYNAYYPSSTAQIVVAVYEVNSVEDVELTAGTLALDFSKPEDAIAIGM